MGELAISIRHPWAYAIFRGEPRKDVENRTWATKHRGRLWIHAGKVFDTSAPKPLAKAARDAPAGCLLGYVTVVDCVRDSTSEWAEPGNWHWLLADPVELPPIPFRGLQGLFDVGQIMYRPPR